MLLLEQRHRLLPRRQIRIVGRSDPVASLQRKGAALDAVDEAAAGGVLPVGRVHGELPDVVPPRRRTPVNGLPFHAAHGVAQGRAVPSVLLVSRVHRRKEHFQYVAHVISKHIVPASRSRHLTSRSEEHTSELQSQSNLVCRLLLEKKKKNK